MQSQLTVRISEELEKEIALLSKKMRLKRSDIVRIALEKLVEDFHVKEDAAPYNKVKGLIGSISSGISDLGEDHRRYLLKKFRKDA